MWTGDNMGTWEHMRVGIKMVLNNNIAGFPFAGCKSREPLLLIVSFNSLSADVGGFFGNPDPEMLVRWYQVGIFGPFFTKPWEEREDGR